MPKKNQETDGFSFVTIEISLRKGRLAMKNVESLLKSQKLSRYRFLLASPGITQLSIVGRRLLYQDINLWNQQVIGRFDDWL